MSVAQLVVNSDIFELLKRDAAIAEDEKLARNRRASFNRYCGEAMKAHRKSLKLSLRAMARSMGVSAMFLHDMEAGKRAYSEKHILAAAEVFSKAGGGQLKPWLRQTLPAPTEEGGAA